MNIGILIKEARLEQNKTLEEVAKNAGVSTAYLSRLENNKRRNPNMTLIRKLENILNIALREEVYLPRDIVTKEIIIGDRILTNNEKQYLQKIINKITA